MKKVIENALEYVKEYFSKDYSGHDYYHTLRVYKLAKSIAIKENANVDIVSLIALLHDVDDIKISKDTNKNKDNARNFLLNNNVDEFTINLVISAINDISFKGRDSYSSSSLEGKIVQDADKLDALGAIGIARAFTYGGNHNRVMYDPDVLPNLNMNEVEYRNHISTTINHFYEKLFYLKDLMNTNTAKEIAIKREQYMKEYIEKFLEEWDAII